MCFCLLLAIFQEQTFSSVVFVETVTGQCRNDNGSLIRGETQKYRNLNVARELEVVARCAARYRESTQYSSSLPRGVNLG